MTLLDATATLIDFAKTNGPWETDLVLARSIKRMEQRFEVLRRRHEKSTRRNWEKAFFSAMGQIGGGADRQTGFAVIIHEDCPHETTFDAFLNCSVISGRGDCLAFRCPGCNKLLIGKPEDEI